MALRTITAPGVQINEIDKSGYTTVPTGTAVYLKGFTSKGEAYRPMEVTTRSSYEQIYGTPDTEAERYTYAAACETLNQGGRLWMARLPYDNASFEKLVGIKYDIRIDAVNDTPGLVNEQGAWHAVYNADNELKRAARIVGGKTPALYDLSAIDEYRTDEARVPANTFLIVDTTGATYSRVPEDTRKGYKREVIGIVPVVTTAANAMYVQNLLTLSTLQEIRNYESLQSQVLGTLVAKDAEGNVLTVDTPDCQMSTGGLLATDAAKLFNTEEYFTEHVYLSSMVSPVDWTYEVCGETFVFQDETAAKEKIEELKVEHQVPDNYYSISSWFNPWLLSGCHLSETEAYQVLLKIADGVSESDPNYSEYKEIVDAWNAKSKTLGYSCFRDAENVGATVANAYINENVALTATQNIDYTIEVAMTESWVPFTNGYATSAERDDAYDGMAALTAYHKDLKKIDGNPETLGKDVYAIVHLGEPELSATYKLPEDDPRYGWHGKDYDDSVPETLALDAASFFPTVQPAVDGEGFDPDHLKDVGVVVYKAYLDPAEGNKVSFEAVEAYAGSLCKDDKDPNTGVTKFLDTIINSQSKYINFFSNCFTSTAAKKFYKDTCDIVIAVPSPGACLGLYSPMTKKDISISKSILDGMNKAFDKVSDINKLDIDIVPDAGLANIASYIKAIFGEKGPYDLTITDDLGNSLLGMWTCKKATDAHVKMWKTVELKHDNFCKNIRKDCMFVADGLRPLVLQGQKKIVRDTKPSNSIDKDILPYVPAICGLNTSYGAGYMDWFEQADDFTGDFFWCPPSIKAMGCYINTDLNYDYWLAPAGLTRGVIAATDVAFSPTGKQAGSIYEKNWNYAINYPQDGIVLEGQKTFQTKPTALDRVNVRRTMLRLERQVYKTARYFVYENNTAYTRQRVIDAIEPIMKACWKSGNGGINRYKIVCDDKINDANTIDNNELKVQIGVVPNKSAEFILVDFVLGNQSSTWAELLG